MSAAETMAERVRRSRLEQGLPPTVEDPEALAKIRTLAALTPTSGRAAA